MENKIFETVSFHIIQSCNMKCKFCYATYNTFGITKQLSLTEISTILHKLYNSGVKKVTFAGGEPMTYKNIKEVIVYAKSIGLITSIISNGTGMTKEWLTEMKPHLDWIGISMDSLNPETNSLIGRKSNKLTDYLSLFKNIKSLGYKFKINTVVNKYNYNENLNTIIDMFKPDRWKVFEALRVKGQNDATFDEVSITSTQYKIFTEKHKHQPSIVIEDNNLLTASYLLIDPKGRFYENWGDNPKKSDSLINNTVEHCLSQIKIDRNMFLERGGVYKW